MYDSTLRSIADQFAPERIVKPPYRRIHDAEDKAACIAACRHKHEFFDQTKKLYWSQRINADESFWRGRTQQVFYRGHLSARILLLFGVPQWSVLDPILFVLYTAELFGITAECGFTAHSYTDDTQVKVSTAASDHMDEIKRLARYIVCICDWMARN